jgi:hypothetical protein
MYFDIYKEISGTKSGCSCLFYIQHAVVGVCFTHESVTFSVTACSVSMTCGTEYFIRFIVESNKFTTALHLFLS